MTLLETMARIFTGSTINVLNAALTASAQLQLPADQPSLSDDELDHILHLLSTVLGKLVHHETDQADASAIAATLHHIISSSVENHIASFTNKLGDLNARLLSIESWLATNSSSVDHNHFGPSLLTAPWANKLPSRTIPPTQHAPPVHNPESTHRDICKDNIIIHTIPELDKATLQEKCCSDKKIVLSLE